MSIPKIFRFTLEKIWSEHYTWESGKVHMPVDRVGSIRENPTVHSALHYLINLLFSFAASFRFRNRPSNSGHRSSLGFLSGRSFFNSVFPLISLKYSFCTFLGFPWHHDFLRGRGRDSGTISGIRGSLGGLWQGIATFHDFRFCCVLDDRLGFLIWGFAEKMFVL